MGIGVTEYIQLAIFALIAVCLLVIFNKRRFVQNLETHSSLSGWLYPAAFCFTYVLGYFYYTTYNLIESIFMLDGNQMFFDANSAEYGGIAAQYMQIELPTNALIALSISYLVYAFITKRKIFRPLYTTLHALILGYLIVVQIAWMYIPQFNQFNSAALVEIAAVALGALIWMPYMLKSKRVKATFVK